MEVKIKYPTHLQEIPLSSYQEWLKVQKNTNDEEILAFKFVSIFCGLDMKTISRMAVKDVHFLIGKIKEVLVQEPKFHKRWKFGGYEFALIPDIENMSWGEFIDVDSHLTEWENIHKAMAVLYRPITKKMDDSYEVMEYNADEVFHEIMLNCPLNIVMSTLVFFWILERELFNNLIAFLKNETKTIQDKTNLANGLNFPSATAGTIRSIELAREIYMSLKEQLDSPYAKPSHIFPTLPKKKKWKQTSVDVE